MDVDEFLKELTALDKSVSDSYNSVTELYAYSQINSNAFHSAMFQNIITKLVNVHRIIGLIKGD